MNQLSEIRLAHQRARFTHPDAHRWWRCDAARYQRFDPRFRGSGSAIGGKVWAESSPDESDAEWQLALHHAQRKHAELRYEFALLRDGLIRGKGYEDQPRVPAGSPEGGQWTTGTEGDDRPILAQLRRTQPTLSTEELLPEGGRNLGTFGSRVTVFVSRDVQDFESLDPFTGNTTISLSGIGQAIVVERDGREFTISRYQVGTLANPGRGLDITIDVNDRVMVKLTQGI